MIENTTQEPTPTPTSGAAPEPAKAPRVPPLMEKRERILMAWNQLAPTVKFADMTVAQFSTASYPSAEAREAIVICRARISALLSQRKTREEALKSLLKRIANAVRCEPTQGDNSPLYRAMGFVPASERKAPRAAAEGTQRQSASSSASLWERYQVILAAWEMGEGASLPGVTLQELQAAGNALEEKQAELRVELTKRAAQVGLKLSSDKATSALIRKVIASVICSTDYGIDCPLYRAMGYIPANERKPSSRRKTAAAPAAPVS